MPRRTRALPALASPCSRRFAPLSSGARSDRRSAPPLCGHAWAARAPLGRAYLPFQCRCLRPEPAAAPWRVAGLTLLFQSFLRSRLDFLDLADEEAHRAATLPRHLAAAASPPACAAL